MDIGTTKLPILSTIAFAYRYLWRYGIEHIMISLIAVLPFCIFGFMGFLDPLFLISPNAENMPEGFNLSFFIFIMTTFIWIIPALILWHRLYLLGPDHLIRRKIWPLFTRSLLVIIESFVFIGIGLVAAAVIAAAILFLKILDQSAEMAGTTAHIGTSESILYLMGSIFLLTFMLLLGLRFSMTFSAMAIGKTLDFTTSWRITRHNSFRMGAVTLMALIPLLGLNAALVWAIKYYFQIDLLSGTAENPNIIFFLILFLSPILSLPLAVLCSLTASFYLHCDCANIR